MGSEANCHCRWGASEASVTALLESTELLLRGGMKHRIPFATMANLEPKPDGLHFRVGHDHVLLGLTATQAAAWARKIVIPPPSLRQKLGLSPEAPAFLVGRADAPELADALHGALAPQAAQARMLIAVPADASELTAALQAHAGLPSATPIWVVHGKGRDAAIGENAVRTFMRAVGFIDSKVTAVSATLTATRYARRSGAGR